MTYEILLYKNRRGLWVARIDGRKTLPFYVKAHALQAAVEGGAWEEE